MSKALSDWDRWKEDKESVYVYNKKKQPIRFWGLAICYAAIASSIAAAVSMGVFDLFSTNGISMFSAYTRLQVWGGLSFLFWIPLFSWLARRRNMPLPSHSTPIN